MPVQTISCVVGNTYNPIAPRRAKKSRKGVKKTHDIQIFVDIIDGNEDAIEKVYFFLGPTFDPQEFICTTPVRTKTKNGTPVSRFATRQQVTGSFSATIKIRGSGGSSLLVPHSVLLNRKSEYTAHSKVPLIFKEPKPIRPFKMIKVPSMARFGIELELSSAMHLQAINVANQLENGTTAIKVIQNYREGKATIDQWKIVPDGSLACNRTEPDCNKFELVSPPLIGGEGLCNISRILTKMGNIQPNLKVNKSMGFHVHIDVSALTTSQLIKICQQFVKYEDVIDSFMPASRRSGSTESKQYFQSNRASVGEQICFDGHGTNRQIYDALQKCDNNEELSNLMNKSGRYYKLNMQNLINGRQPTIEFRQHSATMNYEKVSSWIRFCIFFCWNSATLQSPTPFKESSSLEKKMNGLFQFVIKDRALRNFYRKRQLKLANGEADDCGCCSQCNSDSGAPCASTTH